MAKTVTTIPATISRFTSSPINENKKDAARLVMLASQQTVMSSLPATRRKSIITPTTLRVAMIGSSSRSIPMKASPVPTPNTARVSSA